MLFVLIVNYGQGVETKIIERNNHLYVESVILEHFKGKNDNELVYLKNGLFKIVDYPNLLQFDFMNGKTTSVKLIRGNMDVKIEMLKK